MNKEEHKFWDDFQKAVEQHDDKTLLRLGEEAVDVEDYEKAFKCLENASKFGNIEAKYYLCLSYLNGLGVEENFEIAFKLLKEAAEKGYGNAQFDMGEMYLYGDRVKKSVKKAILWLEKAAEQGITRGLLHLGEYYSESSGAIKKNEKEAFKWYLRAAELGDETAQYIVGNYYYSGIYVVDRNLAESVKWYKKAAKKGNYGAQIMLAEFYRDGIGVRRNSAAAKRWFQKAAEYKSWFTRQFNDSIIDEGSCYIREGLYYHNFSRDEDGNIDPCSACPIGTAPYCYVCFDKTLSEAERDLKLEKMIEEENDFINSLDFS